MTKQRVSLDEGRKIMDKMFEKQPICQPICYLISQQLKDSILTNRKLSKLLGLYNNG